MTHLKQQISLIPFSIEKSDNKYRHFGDMLKNIQDSGVNVHSYSYSYFIKG